MARIFISYRRSDTSMAAGRLHDWFSQRFGPENVFIDVTGIEPGDDFVEAIQRSVSACDVLLAVIGPRWLDAADTDGRRRLDNPNDFVRLEIATALQRGIRVIPVLVDDEKMPAEMPREAELPADLTLLARKQAITLHHASWHSDIGRLVAVLDKVFVALRHEAGQPTTLSKGRNAQHRDTTASPEAQRLNQEQPIAHREAIQEPTQVTKDTQRVDRQPQRIADQEVLSTSTRRTDDEQRAATTPSLQTPASQSSKPSRSSEQLSDLSRWAADPDNTQLLLQIGGVIVLLLLVLAAISFYNR